MDNPRPACLRVPYVAGRYVASHSTRATDRPSAATRDSHFVFSFSFSRAEENPPMTEDPRGVEISVREGWEAVEEGDTQGYTLYPS